MYHLSFKGVQAGFYLCCEGLERGVNPVHLCLKSFQSCLEIFHLSFKGRKTGLDTLKLCFEGIKTSVECHTECGKPFWFLVIMKSWCTSK